MTQTQPVLIILFGASGDLAQRKLYPALYELYQKNRLSPQFAVIGTARRPWSDEYYRQIVTQSIVSPTTDPESVQVFAEHFFYQSHNVKDTEHYRFLKQRIGDISRQFQTQGNQLFYLSISPVFFEVVTQHLKSEGLLSHDGFNRVITEKPFGSSLDTSKELNKALLTSFHERDIYRMDHYLGKSFVQSILDLRNHNPLFEKVWNHHFIDNIQITLAESLKVESRGAYYDQTGALRDMFQSHILQMLSLILMDLPHDDDYQTFIANKDKALMHLVTDKANLSSQFVLGQYIEQLSDGTFHSYHDEEHIDPQSSTETFVAGYLESSQPRWKDSVIYFRTGKGLAKKESRIDLVFKSDSSSPSNILRIAEADQQWSLKIIRGDQSDFIPLDLQTSCNHLSDYSLLIYEALLGHKHYFVHWHELQTSWRIVDQIRNTWNEAQLFIEEYPVGSSGPDSMTKLLQKDHYWVSS